MAAMEVRAIVLLIATVFALVGTSHGRIMQNPCAQDDYYCTCNFPKDALLLPVNMCIFVNVSRLFCQPCYIHMQDYNECNTCPGNLCSVCSAIDPFFNDHLTAPKDLWWFTYLAQKVPEFGNTDHLSREFALPKREENIVTSEGNSCFVNCRLCNIVSISPIEHQRYKIPDTKPSEREHLKITCRTLENVNNRFGCKCSKLPGTAYQRMESATELNSLIFPFVMGKSPQLQAKFQKWDDEKFPGPFKFYSRFDESMGRKMFNTLAKFPNRDTTEDESEEGDAMKSPESHLENFEHEKERLIIRGNNYFFIGGDMMNKFADEDTIEGETGEEGSIKSQYSYVGLHIEEDTMSKDSDKDIVEGELEKEDNWMNHDTYIKDTMSKNLNEDTVKDQADEDDGSQESYAVLHIGEDTKRIDLVKMEGGGGMRNQDLNLDLDIGEEIINGELNGYAKGDDTVDDTEEDDTEEDDTEEDDTEEDDIETDDTEEDDTKKDDTINQESIEDAYFFTKEEENMSQIRNRLGKERNRTANELDDPLRSLYVNTDDETEDKLEVKMIQDLQENAVIDEISDNKIEEDMNIPDEATNVAKLRFKRELPEVSETKEDESKFIHVTVRDSPRKRRGALKTVPENHWCTLKSMTRHGDLECSIWPFKKVCKLVCHSGCSVRGRQVARMTCRKRKNCWEPEELVCECGKAVMCGKECGHKRLTSGYYAMQSHFPIQPKPDRRARPQISILLDIPFRPNPAHPVQPKPDHPVQPKPYRPVGPKQYRPVGPKPYRPVGPKPYRPVQPKPYLPVQPKQDRPVPPDFKILPYFPVLPKLQRSNRPEPGRPDRPKPDHHPSLPKPDYPFLPGISLQLKADQQIQPKPKLPDLLDYPFIPNYPDGLEQGSPCLPDYDSMYYDDDDYYNDKTPGFDSGKDFYGNYYDSTVDHYDNKMNNDDDYYDYIMPGGGKSPCRRRMRIIEGKEYIP